MSFFKRFLSPLFQKCAPTFVPTFVPTFALIFLLSFFFTESAYTQVTRVDSLHYRIAHAPSSSERLILMDTLVTELMATDLDLALTHAERALDFSREVGDKENEALALNNMGIVIYETVNRDSSLKYFERSESLAEQLSLYKLQTDNLMSIARYHRYVTRDSAKTVSNLLKSVEVSKLVNYHWGTARSYAKLASFYTRYKQINLCEHYLELCAKYYLQTNGGSKTVAHYYNEVGNKFWGYNPQKSMEFFFKGKEYGNIPNLMVSLAKAYSYIGDYEKALDYLQESIAYFRVKEKRRGMLGVALAQLAEVQIRLGDFQEARKTCDEGIALLEYVGRSDQKGLPALYRARGMVFEQDGRDELALENFLRSRDEAVKLRSTIESTASVLQIGKFYLQRDIDKSESFCLESYKAATKKKFIDLEVEACDCLYKISKEKRNYVDALTYHEQKIMLKDSLNTTKVMHALGINTKLAEKDKLLAEQAYQKELKEKELKNQYTINSSLLVLTFLGLLFILFLSRSHQRIKKQKNEIYEKTKEVLKANVSLERSNKELERFAHIASHDLKTPVRNIVSFTALLRRRLEGKESQETISLLDFIEAGGKRMNQLIDDVLAFSKLSNDNNVDKEVLDVNQMVKEIAQLVQDSSSSRKVTFDVTALPNLNWYYSKMFLLFKNLIENGIKYNQSENPIIRLWYTTEDGVHSIFIEDNGIGIKKEYFDQIFVMFSRLHTQAEYEGTGLGLATCKKIVEEFGGKINVSSEVGVGTTFKIDIPDYLICDPTKSKELAPTLEKV